MGQPLSMDLRSRVLAAVDEGMSCRAAAARFGVAPSTAIRWVAQRRDTGGFAPKPQGGDMRSQRVEQRRDEILSIWDARKDITLDKLQAGDQQGWRDGMDGGHGRSLQGCGSEKPLLRPETRLLPCAKPSEGGAGGQPHFRRPVWRRGR